MSPMTLVMVKYEYISFTKVAATTIILIMPHIDLLIILLNSNMRMRSKNLMSFSALHYKNRCQVMSEAMFQNVPHSFDTL